MPVVPLPILLGPISRLSRLKAPPPVRARFSLLPGPKSKKLVGSPISRLPCCEFEHGRIGGCHGQGEPGFRIWVTGEDLSIAS